MQTKLRFNKKLLWDYDITEQDLEREDVLILYLSRVLNGGTREDVSEIPLGLIEERLPRLFLSRRVRRFWEWYLAGRTK